MKKKTILATILCALVMTGCGGGAGEVTNSTGDVDVDVNAEVDVDIVSEEDVADEIENVDGELDDKDLEGQMLTPGNINELVGTWYEADVLDSRTLYVEEDASFTLEYPGGGALYGTVEITEEEMPDETVTYWYSFVDQGGDLWEAVAIPDEGIINDLYFGQGGEPHFVRGGEG